MPTTQVKEIMVSDIITANMNDSVFAVYELFKKHKFHHIPIVNKKQKLKGIISWTDIERLKVGAGLFKNPKKEEYTEALFHSMRACDIMGSEPVCIECNKSIEKAYRIFKKNEFHALPVMDQGELVGIVTPLDILDYFFKFK